MTAPIPTPTSATLDDRAARRTAGGRGWIGLGLRCRSLFLITLGLVLTCLGCAPQGPARSVAPAGSAPIARSGSTLTEVGTTDWDPFSRWTLRRPDGPSIDVYAARKDGRRPTILLLPGSKCFPLFWILPGRRVSALFLQEAVPDLVEDVNVVAFDRRGLTSFGPPPTSEEDARAQSVCTPQRGGVSKAERVDDAAAVASALVQQPWVSKLWIVGHSAGADVAAGVAERLGPEVDAVALFAGAGITRFFEASTIARRKDGSAGAAEVLGNLIAATGPNPPLEVGGDPLVTVQTYAVDSTPLDDLRGSSVPVFVAHCDADDKVPVEAADAFVAEVLRERGRPVHYVVVPGCNHGFVDAEGRVRSEEVARLFIEWAGSASKPRGVRVLGE